VIIFHLSFDLFHSFICGTGVELRAIDEMKNIKLYQMKNGNDPVATARGFGNDGTNSLL